MSSPVSVLIVGAGPAGLIAAIALLKNHIPIRIIEKRPIPHGGVRGTAIQPRTLELFAFLGVLDDVLAVSTPPFLMAMHGVGREVLKETRFEEEADESPHVPYPRSVHVGQHVLERVLRENIDKLGARVEFGVELVSFEQHAEQVVTELSISTSEHTPPSVETLECTYMIAADGAKGRVRRNLGLSFLGETKETERMFTANVEVHGLDRAQWHMWGSFSSAGFGLKPISPEPLFQVQALGPDLPTDLPRDTKGVQELFNSISGAKDIELLNASWTSEWRANIRLANALSVGRVFLSGDAAHSHSPAGGQGENTAMQDSLNIAWKLALALQGVAAPSLLDTYQVERMPVIAEMLSLSTELHTLAFHRIRTSTLDPEKPQDPETQEIMHRPRRLLQLGVNYRWSPIVIGDHGDDTNTEKDPYGQGSATLRAGDRAPDARPLLDITGADNDIHSTRPVSLHSTFTVDRHTILIFPPTSGVVNTIEFAALQQIVARMATVTMILAEALEFEGHNCRTLVDVERTAYLGYNVPESTGAFVVVRPDGIIGAYGRDMGIVFQYFATMTGHSSRLGARES
ncbi:FAD binding domain-containing protein [Rhodofomes roseus]|uniref:FAD binding domain-containing protein n=1 Tax=Rhodofomes roseus TaxID=34475 RepID=A0ABQ8K1S6_9APHY|nr:FAD binding domain-containing protein [Rhodofomes roseus]KAH9830219.1 FAD binding domain-containing protein [Rhodofomes roseus]